MEKFKYKEMECKFDFLEDFSFEEFAKSKEMNPVIVKSEEIETHNISVRLFATKYTYMSKNTGNRVFAYEFIENHGSEGSGTYLLTSVGDFEDLKDLFSNFLNWIEN